MKENSNKLIHVGLIQKKNLYKPTPLLLRQKESTLFSWSELSPEFEETDTGLVASSLKEALRLALRHWKNEKFRTLNCGFRYTLPERDEHGTNALFHQMADSYANSSGIYFDDELGHPCLVRFASDEALNFWKSLSSRL